MLVEQRYLAHAQPSGTVAALRELGHEVRVIDPEAASYEVGDNRWLQGLDLVVARGRSWPVLCLLAWAEAYGIPAINRGSAIRGVYNKAHMALTLQSGAVPMPLTLFGSPQELARRVPAHQYPLILKPVFGDNGTGLRLVHTRQQLLETQSGEAVVLAQQFIANEGYDLKLYCIADEAWAVRKPAQTPELRAISATVASLEEKPEIVPMTPALRQIAIQCRDLFGLDLFGVDCLETPCGPLVIEVNDFPNYSAVPEASERLARYVVQQTREWRAA